MNRSIVCIFAGVLILCLLSAGALAAGKILGIEISGNRNVSKEKILRVLRMAEGSTYDEEEFKRALKRLFATREFADVKGFKTVSPGGVQLEIVLVEYPRADEVRFEGVAHITEEELRKKVTLGKGSFIRPAAVAADEEAIVEMYKEKGYFRAAVEDTLVKEEGKNILVYRVNTGDKVSIKHIDFFGNGALDSDELRDAMKSKEDRWWRGGDYKPKQLEEDMQAIIEAYRRHGYLDAEIKGKELIFSEDGKDLDIFITVEEGPLYRVGKIDWTGNEVIGDDEIRRMITMNEGDVFDDAEFQNLQVAVSTLYWDRGYIYNSVTPVKKVKGRVIDATLEIFEGEPAHISEIRIEGNTKTSEEVIRRELVIAPGDVFIRPKLVRSLREVFNLGFFEGPPEVTPTPSSKEGNVDITIKVKEKQTGQFRMGAGFSELNSVSGFFGITEPNFLGRGEHVGVDWEFSRYRQNIDVRFTEPWLFGTPTELSVNVYNMVQNQVRQQFYDDRRKGFSVRLGRPFPWFDYTSIYWRYKYESVKLSNFSSGYVGPLTSVKWPRRTSSVAVTLSRNSTDSPFHPTTGTSSMLLAEWNGGTLLGGDENFQRYETSIAWYTPLFSKFVLEMNFQAGVLDGFVRPTQVPDYELFRLGGNRRYGVRGYDYYEIVPDGNPEFIGGRYMQILSYQVSYELSPMVYALLFLDAGNTWNSFREADPFDLKKGAGVGIRFELPMLGTVGLDYGYGFDKKGGGAWEPHISFGGLF
jgi:outer membrane protein insertion porin family